MVKKHIIKNLVFHGTELILSVDSITYRVKLRDISARLVQATETQRKKFAISPSGYGIHWPLINEDLSVDGLLAVATRTVRRCA